MGSIIRFPNVTEMQNNSTMVDNDIIKVYQKDHTRIATKDIIDAIKNVFVKINGKVIINGATICSYIRSHPNVTANDLDDLMSMF